jgi:hypothetical protein
MLNRENILGRLTPYTGNKVKLTESQSTNDIIKEILNAHQKYAADYDKIAPQFWKGSVKASCNYVFNFLKKNVKYKIEPDSRQSVKSPAAIIATGANGGYNDCKHYSLFFCGLLDAWRRSGKNINFCYRFANYRLLDKKPHHVFTVVNPGGNEIWCDAVLSSFNEKKQYINKIDKKPMALYSISGVECETCESYGTPTIGAPRRRAARKAKRAERKVKRKAKRTARRTARRSGPNCKGRTVAKIAPPLIVGRKAFLLLVRLNAKKIAVKLYNRLQDPKKATEIYEKWCKLGGNAKVLRENVNKAYAKYKRKRGIASVGEPVSLATIITTALPILTAMAKFLKPERAEEIEETSSAIQEGASNLSNESEGEGDTTSGIFDNKKILIYGAIGIAGYYFLTKKKIFK